ncbi:MAG: Gfo/Idh/MocA family oxidoreductase [Aestuariivirga sp.]|uniref:Gfo/Idh/MocA family protein n=1 Tax=Aestuariivirga sp. TaxID=2650926 RepID=UPI0025BCA4A0|nr:Gfo/Idh/MocA family oxidoreductase [Aestuariivirga sp.]MCA3562091.1 Gfo/Idh/MocA family oxidoreductase [Aestuariivirga sp.]
MARLNWGMIGGGEGSQIGPVHRISAAMDGLFTLAAGALDIDPAKGRDFAQRIGIAPGRAYGDWRAMLAGERGRPDRVDLVTVATPNATHYGIAKAFLEEGIHVLCEKPMTVTVEEAEDIAATAQRTGAICAVNYGYTGYPLVRHMRAMVARGELGRIRLCVVEFSHGFHADAADAENPRMRWRYDPALAGLSGQFADCGIHALNMASFVTGENARELSADFLSAIASRKLEDDAMVNVRMDGGTRVRLWTSSVAVGSFHGLNIRVFGEKGGLRWAQQWPDQLHWTPLNGRAQVIERGAADSPDAARATRIATGHSEGMLVAFANIYADLAEAIHARREGRAPDPAAGHYPTAADGLRSIAAIKAAVDSAAQGGQWVDARPPSLRR